MSLIYTNLQNEIYKIFDAMNSIYSNGEEYFASRLAEEISNYISQGVVTTTDGGKGSAGGVYVGNGKGTMKIDNLSLKNTLLQTTLSKSNNYEIARRMANNIDTICSMPNVVTTITSGESTIPNTPPVVYKDGGSGKGSFVSTSSIIFLRLKNCFDSMDKMTINGNMYFAQELAKGVDEYLKAGSISVTLQFPLSGSGSGKIS